MYQNIYFDKFKSEIHIWDDKTGYERVKFKNYAYILNDNGTYTTIDGSKCSKVYSWSETAVKTKMVCEHDVPETTRYLIDRYVDSDSISDNVITMFFDIEVAKEGKYSTPEEANNTITSIAYYTDLYGYHTLLLDKNNPTKTYTAIIKPDKKELSVKVTTFNDEKSLLFAFLKEYRNISPHILTGWNIDYFDIPYLYNRMVNILDIQYANQLSPINKVKVKQYGKSNIIQIAGVTSLDYLMLYKKFTYSEQSNYRLNTISNVELKRSKIEYTGDLDYLYATDINKFIEYNVVDVDLVLELDRKLDLINIARGICHKGHVPYDDIIFTSKYLDGAALTYCRRNNLIATSTRTSGESTTAEGAFVKDPTPGLYKWVYDLDLTSLYPMNIISLNISPETKFAKILNWDEEDYINSPDKLYDIKLFRDDTVLGNFSNEFGVKSDSVRISGNTGLAEFVKKHNLSIASNGVMYILDKIGLIPAILDSWFNDRDNFKNLRKQYEKSNDSVLAAYYDKQQLITKIMLNSFYGVLLLETFRFYDKDNGEAVTITGKSVIKWGSKMANYFYHKKLGTEHIKDFTIYIDTDSLFLPILPLLDGIDTDTLTDTEIIELAKPLVKEVQEFINKSYTPYAKKFHMIDTHRWDIKQELIARRALWIAKKRYAQWIVIKEGFPIEKLDVKGLDVVRSSFPTAFRNLLKQVLIDILHDKPKKDLDALLLNFKKTINTTDLNNILFPTGAKEIKKYETDIVGKVKTGTPAHIKSAINYNHLMELFNINNMPKIADGDKILWGYLHSNPYNFESLALTGNFDDEKIIEFMEKYVDKNKIFESGLLKKLQAYWDAMQWGEITFNSNVNKFF